MERIETDVAVQQWRDQLITLSNGHEMCSLILDLPRLLGNG